MDDLSASAPSIWTQLRLLTEWSPLLSFGQQFLSEQDPHKKSLLVADCLEFLASKSKTPVDDELVLLLTKVLESPQGEAVVRWAVAKLEGPKV